MKANAYAAGMYAAGAQRSFDALALHPYGTTPGNVIGQVESLREAIAHRGDDAPIWVTEFGWGTGGRPSSLWTTSEQQAERIGATVEEFHARRAELGLRGFVYYQWADGIPSDNVNDTVWFHVGLVGPARQLKLAWHQMATSVGRMGLGAVAADAPGRPLPSGCRPSAAQIAPPAPLIGPSNRQKPGIDTRAPAPRLASLTLRPARFRAARRGPALRKAAQCGRRSACGGRFGSRLTFRASRAGTLELRIRRLSGRRAVDVRGVVKHRVRSGRTALRLLGRVRSKALRRGRYAAIVQLVGRNGRRSKTVTRRFTIVR
jgi:hypothetical protein